MHGLSAITALTAQNTRGVTAVHVPPVDFLRAQIDACFDDFHIGAVKIGMLATAEVIVAVADALEAYGNWLVKHRKPTAKRDLDSAARAHILPELGKVELGKLTTARLRRWHEGLADQPRRLRTRPGVVS